MIREIRDWDTYCAFLLEFEGVVLEHDSDDAGGLTKFGIDHRSHPGVDIAALTRESALAIYRAEYDADQLAHALGVPLGLVHFDAVVNCGSRQAVRFFQRACLHRAHINPILSIAADGVVGPATLAAARLRCPWFAAAMLDQRRAFYNHLSSEKPRLQKFLRGWLRRCTYLEVSVRVAPDVV